MLFSGTLLALAAAVALAGAGPSQGAQALPPTGAGVPASWRSYRASVLRDPSLLRLYTFENIGNGASIPDAASGGHALIFRPIPKEGSPDEQPRMIRGMWKEKTAVRLDRGVYEGEPFALSGRCFTIEAWLRKSGQGDIPGDRSVQSGTLLSMGSGYWSGFRITTSYPAMTLGFEIGRPQPGYAVGLWDVGPLADGVWNHVAATWDGKEMRLYLNGLLAGSRPYDGEFTPPGPGDRFRIGYNAHGWGSTKLDVDEVAAYGRALGPAEILSHSLDGASIAADLAGAAQIFNQHQYKETVAWCRGILASPDPKISPDASALARLLMSAALRRMGDAAGAGRELAAILDAASLSERFRAAAVLDLVRLNRAQPGSLPPAALARLIGMPAVPARDHFLLLLSLERADRKAGRFAKAEKENRELMNDASTPAGAQADLRLEMAHALRQQGDYAGAHSAYSAIAHAPDARTDLRDYAGLLAADCLVSAHKWADARAAFRSLLASNAPTLSRQLEIGERLKEIDRLEAGRTARDPEGSRRRIRPLPVPGAKLFVAPNGSDAAVGDSAHPLASFAGAVLAVRAIKAHGALPKGGIAVVFRAGEYRVTETIRLSAEDSGSAASPIVYRAVPGASVRFTGGVRLQGFSPVTDPAMLARLPEAARGKVVGIDLLANHVTDLGRLAPQGMMVGNAVTELFFNGRALQLARWPNEGWLKTGKVSHDNLPEGEVAFAYTGERPARWATAKDAWIFGYPKYLWADARLPIAGIDPASHVIRVAVGSTYGVDPGMPYYVYNLLEELDTQGEWYLDRETGQLFLYPPSDPTAADVQLSVLSAPFVEMDGASYVRLEHLTFEFGRSDGIVVKDGEHCLIAGCTVRRLGGTGVLVEGGHDDGIFGCDIYCMGRGGTSIKGGDRRTLTPSGHFVENCHIYDFSRWGRTYTPAVYTDGVGMHIAHNLIHDSPGHAMRLEGNDQVVEYNDVHHVIRETDDQGAVDIFYNITYRGLVLRYNFWHFMGDGSDRLMHAGIRLDDAISGVTMYGNVFYNSSEGLFGGVQIHGGNSNVVENNLFVRCKYGVSFSQWGADRWRKFIEGPDAKKMTAETVDISKPPYSTRYPALAHLTENIDINMIWRNIACGCSEFLTRDNNKENMLDNLLTAEDTGIVAPHNGDFSFRAGSSLLGQTGFRPIPFQEIGLYADPLRASWPVDNRFMDHF
jgi:hypothetical protein